MRIVELLVVLKVFFKRLNDGQYELSEKTSLMQNQIFKEIPVVFFNISKKNNVKKTTELSR